MKLPRRKFLHLTAGAAAMPAVSRIAWAQSYPSRPVRIIVGFPAGGTSDVLARLMGQWLSERLGRPFIVENRPGAGGNVGTEAVVRATADGYTLLQAGGQDAVNATLYQNLNFNFIRDMAPVIGIMRVPGALVFIHRFRSRPSLNSSPMPKPIPARSISRRLATAARSTSMANCSR
jgi:tripartite-type tricarboxylate transporter receptor subunit TctC